MSPAWSGEDRTGKLEEVTLQLGTEKMLKAERKQEQHVQRPKTGWGSGLLRTEDPSICVAGGQ